ncbi:response regulator transcription factor [bacterium]|nr:response regulator transcription factor [bacterium]
MKSEKNTYLPKEQIAMFTQREREILNLMIRGRTNQEIAEEMIISINTAKAHVSNILNKLGVKDRVQAVVKAIRCNLI